MQRKPLKLSLTMPLSHGQGVQAEKNKLGLEVAKLKHVAEQDALRLQGQFELEKQVGRRSQIPGKPNNSSCLTSKTYNFHF